MVTVLCVIFGFVGCVCVCVCFGCSVFKKRLVSWGPLCECMYVLCPILKFISPCHIFSSFGISFVVLFDMRSLKNSVHKYQRQI